MKNLQDILLEQYLAFTDKTIDKIEPNDSLALNRALYKCMTSHFYKENKNLFFLFENEKFSYILNNNLLENDRRNDYYSVFLSPGNNPEYDFSLPIEEYKYSTCDYMTDEEFDEHEEKIKNKVFYSLEDLNTNQKIILSKKDLRKIKDINKFLGNKEKIPEQYKHFLSSIVSILPNINQDNKKHFETIIKKEEKEINKMIVAKENEEFLFFINHSEKSIINNDYLMHKIKNKHNIQLKNPEDILVKFKENPIFKEFLKNYNENELEILTEKNLKNIIEKEKEILYKSLNNNINELIDFNKNLESVLEEEKTEQFIKHLKKDNQLKKILTEDPLEQKVIEQQLKDYNIEHIEYDDDFFENISNKFSIHFDSIDDIYASNNMKIIKNLEHDYNSKQKSFQIIAKNENQIIGGINMVEGSYHNYKDFDYVMTGIATSNKFRNIKIAETLFREALDFCVKNNKNMIRTKPTIDGNTKIYEKFTKIANEPQYSTILVIKDEENHAYQYLQNKIFEAGGDQKNLNNVFKTVRDIKQDKKDYPNNETVNSLINKELKTKNNNKNKLR